MLKQIMLRQIMLKPILSLALLAAWSPAALAFPPCPLEPVDLEPLDAPGAGEPGGTNAVDTAPWFRGVYALVGDSTVLAAIRPFSPYPKSGKCRDRDALPVPDDHSNPGFVGLSPGYAPRSGFGIVALPDLRKLERDLTVVYTLEFSVDNTALASIGDWFDVAELRFQSQQDIRLPEKKVSAVYRVRKRHGRNDMPTIEIIEARAEQYTIGPEPRATQRIVAAFPMEPGKPSTRVLLRWGQVRSFAGDGEFGLPPPEGASGFETDIGDPASSVDAWLEVVDPQDDVVDRIALPGQWASELAMGLLNYNTGNSAAYAQRNGFVLDGMRIGAIAD
jgi:hypothetical protein